LPATPPRRRAALHAISLRSRGTRPADLARVRTHAWFLASALIAACASSDRPAPPLPDPLEEAFASSLRPGDVIVLVPGTGARDYLGAPIDALPGDVPTADILANESVRTDAVVFEQAIGVAERAGLSREQIENGDVTLLIWGAGFERVQAFDYVSYDRLRVRVQVLGGQNAVAVGLIEDHYFDYTRDNVDTDARDIYQRLSDWLAAHPADGRNVVVVSHSYGGAVGEYLALEHDTIAKVPLPGDTALPFTISAGVPPYVVGYDFLGPRVMDLHPSDGSTSLVYEIDRPDDPVHNLTFQGDFRGHHYNIVFGDQFEGSYGVTTDKISCGTVPGPCAK
jgi:pimeloyl-ACP methyl ester carboxylesterase